MVKLPALSRQRCMHCPAMPTLIVNVTVVGRLLIDSVTACNAAALLGAAEHFVIVVCDMSEECR